MKGLYRGSGLLRNRIQRKVEQTSYIHGQDDNGSSMSAETNDRKSRMLVNKIPSVVEKRVYALEYSNKNIRNKFASLEKKLSEIEKNLVNT